MTNNISNAETISLSHSVEFLRWAAAVDSIEGLCPAPVVRAWTPPKYDYLGDDCCVANFVASGWVHSCPCSACNP